MPPLFTFLLHPLVTLQIPVPEQFSWEEVEAAMRWVYTGSLLLPLEEGLSAAAPAGHHSAQLSYMITGGAALTNSTAAATASLAGGVPAKVRRKISAPVTEEGLLRLADHFDLRTLKAVLERQLLMVRRRLDRQLEISPLVTRGGCCMLFEMHAEQVESTSKVRPGSLTSADPCLNHTRL